ncbi:MAG: patatin-like phospholipase family protein [Bacteroidota bacterium]
MESQKVHLVCSSGGMKCFSYIGALRKLQENDIEIASVSTCSLGTVIGAMLCAGMDIDTIEQKILNFNFAKLRKTRGIFPFRFKNYPFAKLKTPKFDEIMVHLIGEDITLGQMKIPISVAAVDLRQRRFLVYSSESHPDMKISEAIQIGTAVPLLYPPYKMGKRILVDAALASESPVWMAASNPGYYPIVVLKPLDPPDNSYLEDIFTFLPRLFSASARSHDFFNMSQTSRAIEVGIPCEGMNYANFKITKDQIENLILEGQSAMEKKLRDFQYDFSNVLEVEEIKSVYTQSNSADKAEALATQMINEYQNESRNRHKIFVSYSHDDRNWMLKMRNYLKSVERFEGIKAWDDLAIKAGDEWNREIEKALATTKVAVFLVTQNFLASEFIQEKEMGYFLEISKKENVPIIWVAVSSSLYEITPLKHIQCANDPEKPLDSLSEAEQNATLTNISKQIVQLMEESS